MYSRKTMNTEKVNKSTQDIGEDEVERGNDHQPRNI